MNELLDESFIQFMERFRTEEQCFDHLKKVRWPEGFLCRKCGHTVAYFTRHKKVFECAKCGGQTSITARTLFHRTHLPLKKWFMAIYLVGTDRRDGTPRRLEKILDVNYVTAWQMVRKIRHAMGEHESSLLLKQVIEMDHHS